MKTQVPRVALLIESSRHYGRGILRGIARYTHANGPWSCFLQERELHSGIPNWLKTWRGDGIIARIENREMAKQLLKLGCPVVDVLGQSRFPGVPSFDTDAKAVAKLAADFLLKAGFTHFAYSGYPGIPFSDQRGEAFAKHLSLHGHKMVTMPMLPSVNVATHIQAIEQQGIIEDDVMPHWLKKQARPLGIFACNDIRAQQVLHVCREHGIRVPEEIAVIGVDNDDVLCGLCDPPLTSIEPDTERMGYEAATLLAQLMAGATKSLRNSPWVRHVPPLRLVERTSTDIVAMEDPIMVQAVRFIRNEIGNQISVKDVLAHVGRSRTDLDQRFRGCLGSSIRDEIQRHRLDRVCCILRETELNLAEAAQRAGFASSTHLCRLFQKHFHQTPTEFRRSARSAS